MSLWHSAARAHSLLPTLSAARRAYTRRLKENPVRRRLTTEAEDLTKPEDVRRGKSWDMVSAAEDLTSPQPREHGWDFYVWMGVVTLIPPALAVLVGEYGRYDMKQAEARDERAPVPRCVCCAPKRFLERKKQVEGRQKAAAPVDPQLQLLDQLKTQVERLQAEVNELRVRVAPAEAASSSGRPDGRAASSAGAAGSSGQASEQQVPAPQGWPTTRRLWTAARGVLAHPLRWFGDASRPEEGREEPGRDDDGRHTGAGASGAASTGHRQ